MFRTLRHLFHLCRIAWTLARNDALFPLAAIQRYTVMSTIVTDAGRTLGRVLADLQDPAGRLPETSGATEHQGQLYVQSLHAEALGMLPLPVN